MKHKIMHPYVFTFNLYILSVFSLVESEMPLSHTVRVVRLQNIASWKVQVKVS